MLTILFFIAVFSSLLWCAYALLYIHGLMAGADLSSLSAETMALYVGLLVVPVWALWQIFGFISRHFQDKNFNLRLTQLFNQMKKNQDYTDLVVRVMLDAEHEIKDGFVINKFDIFVADMNELLADIVQRCNAASSLQLEQLWARVKNGERWTIGKTLIEAAKNYADFSTYLAEKARKDSVFKGTLLEFCARYQSLSALLEKHDRDRVFITIIETGVMGKVYSILAPAADALEIVAQERQLPPETEDKTFDVSPNILTMEAPQNDEESVSFFSRLNPFKKKRKAEEGAGEETEGDEAFFTALQKSMNSPEETHKSFMQGDGGNTEINAKKSEPRFFCRPERKPEDLSENPDVQINTPKAGVIIQEAVRGISAADKNESVMPAKTGDENQPAAAAEYRPAGEKPVSSEPVFEEPVFDAGVKNAGMVRKPEPAAKPQNDDFAYPFGGWMNEENYKK